MAAVAKYGLAEGSVTLTSTLAPRGCHVWRAEAHGRLAVLGAPAGVGTCPVSRLHAQSGHDRPAQDQLRFGQTGENTGNGCRTVGGHPVALYPENTGRPSRRSEKCWCAPQPTLPANGTGDRVSRKPCARATRLRRILARINSSAAATGALVSKTSRTG